MISPVLLLLTGGVLGIRATQDFFIPPPCTKQNRPVGGGSRGCEYRDYGKDCDKYLIKETDNCKNKDSTSLGHCFFNMVCIGARDAATCKCRHKDCLSGKGEGCHKTEDCNRDGDLQCVDMKKRYIDNPTHYPLCVYEYLEAWSINSADTFGLCDCPDNSVSEPDPKNATTILCFGRHGNPCIGQESKCDKEELTLCDPVTSKCVCPDNTTFSHEGDDDRVGNFMLSKQICRAKENTPCSSSTFSCIPNSECVNNLCKCRSGFKKDDDGMCSRDYENSGNPTSSISIGVYGTLVVICLFCKNGLSTLLMY